MPIYRLLQNSAFEPEHVTEMVRAYEAACAALGLVSRRHDPFAENVAAIVIEVAQTGVKSADEICEQALIRLTPKRRR